MHKRLDDNGAPAGAFFLRSAALFGALLQYDFLAKDLTDTAVSCTTLLIALTAGTALSTMRLKAVQAIPALLLAPVAARLLIALPRWFSDNLAVNTALDALLLDYDRNHTVLILPFYYAAITAFCARASRRSLRSCALLDCALIALTFSIARSAEMRVYHLPVILLSVFGLLLALELAVIILSIPKDAFISRRETGISCALLACFLIAGGILFFFEAQKENYHQQSANGSSGTAPAGNGLIKPGLFSFDMTPFLNLNTEVSMGDELVLIVRKEKKDDHILMRRFVLSAYNSVKTGSVEAGFTRHEVIDEKTQRREVPTGRLELSLPEYRNRQRLKQEYYIKNIDGASLLGMNEPESITPFENYNESSFKSVYEVESMVSVATPYQLFESAVAYRSDPYFGMSREEFLWYTAFANAKGGITLTEQGIKDLAEYLTENYSDNFTKTIALLEYFTQGDFRYSLKPGIAADGDQLHHFLFETKRGYCSYFALAFASTLRALGIPSRIAVGFYLDPATESFGFYPIRSGNAHAWVEVFFPEYGWIEFNPTTDVYAEDELEPSMGNGDNFEQLMKEILENRSKLKQKSAMMPEDEESFFEKIRETARQARPVLVPLLFALILFAALMMRGGYFWLSLFAKEPRRKTLLLWRHILFRLRLQGMKAPAALSEAQWIETLPCKTELAPLYEALTRARYAPSWTAEDAARFFDGYKALRPFFKTPGKQKGKTALLVFVLGALTLQQSVRAQELLDANALSDAAFEAEQSEYWERAIALYNEGKRLYPDDWRFPMSLGDLYFRKALYTLAQEEYRAAYILVPDYLDLIYKLAIVSGSLNENGNAADYFEQYLQYAPDDIDVISELGWMYFKLHRLEEGEELLLSAIQTHGVTRRLAMTLATIYSDMLNYQESSRWYTTAITLSQTTEYQYRSQDFSATAYYNYAILESRFYNYETAFALAQNSLNMSDRDTGHMMRGELYLRRFDVGRAYTEYARAFEMDKQSPLPKVSLAQIHLITGRLEEARLYAEDCLNATNHAWMFRFGIDPDQYARDLHEILYKSYEGLINQERFISYGSFKERWAGFIKTMRFRAAARTHKRLYEKYSLYTARSYSLPEQGGQYLEALLQYINAFNGFPSRARYYLHLAEAYETALIPRSKGEYLYLRGKIERNGALLEEALLNLDATWERDKIADVYTELYHTAKHRGLRVKARETAEALYLLNPGALAQNGIRLPASLRITGGTARDQRNLRGIVLKSGFEAVNPAKSPGRLELELVHTGDLVQIALKDLVSGTVLQRRTVPAPDRTAVRRAAFATNLREMLFTFRYMS